MNVYLTSTVELNLVKFHSGIISTHPRSAPTRSAIQLLLDTIPERYTQKNCALIMR